jgi:hypothetical protein
MAEALLNRSIESKPAIKQLKPDSTEKPAAAGPKYDLEKSLR